MPKLGCRCYCSSDRRSNFLSDEQRKCPLHPPCAWGAEGIKVNDQRSIRTARRWLEPSNTKMDVHRCILSERILTMRLSEAHTTYGRIGVKGLDL